MKKLIITLAIAAAWILAFNVNTAAAQAPPLKWDVRFGGIKEDYLYDLQQTSDGEFILGGISNSGAGIDKTDPSRGGSDYWIIKMRTDRTIQWNKTFGGSGHEYLKVVKQTTDGGYILGGTSLSSDNGDRSQPTQGGSDYWIVKTDHNGNISWDIRFGGSGDDDLQALLQTEDGGYMLGGTSNSPASGDRTHGSWGGKDMWIIKLTANGAVEWNRRFGGTGDDHLNSIIQTHPDGGYLLAGSSNSPVSGDKTQASRGGYDFWVVRLFSNGQKHWDERFGGTLDDKLTSACQDMLLGGFLLGGSSKSAISGDKSQGSQGGSDFWTVMINGSGSKVWDKRFGGSSDDAITDLEQTRDGGYILGGYSFSGLSGDKTQVSRGSSDMWTVKITMGGAKIWDAGFGGDSYEMLYCLQQIGGDNYILGGTSLSHNSGDKTQDSRGSFDFWIVQQGACVTTSHCSDNDVCTLDGCLSGNCLYLPQSPNDGNACTIDDCDPVYGEEHRPKTCNDNDACTTNSCNISFGCYYTPIPGCCTSNAQCNDDDACTEDYCSSNSCVHFTIFCHDTDPCTSSACDPDDGCTFLRIPGCCATASDCNDGNACTTDACNSGTCANTFIERRITSFTLVNSAAETDISPLVSGSVINLSTTPNINVRANLCTGSGTGSVEFRLNGTRVMVENGAPYAIASDVTGNYNNWSIAPGTYTIQAIPYSSYGATGTAGTPLSITISVTGSSACTAVRTVSSFTLVNSDTDMDIGPLTNGSVINLAATPNVNVRANLCTNTGTGSVKFNLNGIFVRNENSAPWALAGGSPYDRWSISPGSYAIQAIPFQGTNGTGTMGTGMTINITVVNSSAKMAADEVTSFEEIESAAESANLSTFPNPFKEELTIQFSLLNSEKARVDILNMEGRMIASPFNGMANENEVITVKFQAGSLPEGMYFCRMTTESGVMQNRKLMLVR